MIARAAVAVLCVAPLLALAQPGLKRVPLPADRIDAEVAARLAGDKASLDKRHDSLASLFADFNARCRAVDKRDTGKVASCRAEAAEIQGFARAYWKAYCAYVDANRVALEAQIEKARVTLRQRQEAMRGHGLAVETTARAYEDWTEATNEQLRLLEKERLDHVVGLVLGLAAKLESLHAGNVLPLLERRVADDVGQVLRRKGLTDAEVLRVVKQMGEQIDVRQWKANIELLCAWVRRNVETGVKLHDLEESKTSFEQSWAIAQLLVVHAEFAAKLAEWAGKSGPMPVVGAAAQGTAGAIAIGGHSAVAFLWTYDSLRALARLEEYQLILIDHERSRIEHAVKALNLLKVQLPRYRDESTCGVPGGKT